MPDAPVPTEAAHPMGTPDEEHIVEVEGSPQAVWAVVSDVTRTPEWSPVVVGATWIDDVSGPELGARFRGDNRFNGFRWSRQCEVTACDPPRVFAFSTFGRDGREQTRWRYTIETVDDTTRLTLAYQVVTLPRWVALAQRVPGMAKTSARQATENMTSSLQRIAELASAASARP